ncbi:FAD-binding protein [Ancrocorticia populi]|uniref:FAD-binding protein n=1 Tax=Ancrocorticia populi TaxID=2175228 RepID=UPI003F90B47D
METDFDYVCDVLVAGSGASGLAAALAAHDAGGEPLVLEASDLLGGSSAMSGGEVWIPNNPLMKPAGARDSEEEARTYLDSIIGEEAPESSRERRETFIKQGPEMVSWLTRLGMEFQWVPFPDYYPENPGGKGTADGRSLEAKFFDLKTLGGWQDKVRGNASFNIQVPMLMHGNEAPKVPLAVRSLKGFATGAKIFGVRTIGPVLKGQKAVSSGGAFIGRLLALAFERSIPVWAESPLLDLITDSGEVVGATVLHRGRTMRIGARRGVVLTTGGFAHNDEMRTEYHQQPTESRWSAATDSDSGAGVQAGIDVGAATAMMGEKWWMPTVINPDGSTGFMMWERFFPYSIIVDSSGERFANEALPYNELRRAMQERNEKVGSIPSYLIMDSRHRRYYPFGTMLPGITPKSAIESGFMVKADSLDDLARQCGINASGLRATVERFNRFAATGKDEDFGRGDSEFDRFDSDPRVKPNPNLGAIQKGPFYAVKVYPGDIGTKGGLLTDEYARVLRAEDGQPIPGLYAAGNTSASVMGKGYAGPGGTLAPAMVFGMIGGRHAIENND